MLLEFKFSNFKSYATECLFSMMANSDKAHEGNLENVGKKRVSKVRLIYGANASGKTSFVDAIGFVNLFAKMSNKLMANSRINVIPYKFRDNYAQEPSSFYMVFLKDGVKYAYSFSCTFEKVIDEKLDVYYSAKPTNIFTRTNTDKYDFLSIDAKELNGIVARNTDNKLFLITAATWNYEKAKPAAEFITSDLVVLYDTSKGAEYNLDYVIQHNDMDAYRDFCLSFLNNADLSISDFRIKSRKLSPVEQAAMSGIMSMVMDNETEKSELLANMDVHNVDTLHKISVGNETNDFWLKLLEESRGTQELFYLAPTLFYTLRDGKVLVLDEIDRSLHPLLVEYLINKFLNKETNKGGAQLIANTHDMYLLNLELFRRDEIWFTERNNSTGMSEMYALSDFSPRKDENIFKAYILGRYGAIPFIVED